MLFGRQIKAKEFLVTEPSLCTPVFAHKGTVRLQFHVSTNTISATVSVMVTSAGDHGTDSQ